MPIIPEMYLDVVNDVISKCAELFSNENISADVLSQLNELWLSKLKEKGDEYIDLNHIQTKARAAPKKKLPIKKIQSKPKKQAKPSEVESAPCNLSMPDIEDVVELRLNRTKKGSSKRALIRSTFRTRARRGERWKNADRKTSPVTRRQKLEHGKSIFKPTTDVIRNSIKTQTAKPAEKSLNAEKINYIYKNNDSYEDKAGDTPVKIILPHLKGHSIEERTCIVKAPCWSLAGTHLPKLLHPLIKEVMNLTLTDAASILQQYINNYGSVLQVDGNGVKVNLKPKYTCEISKKTVQENSDIDSSDDVTDEENTNAAFESGNSMMCLFTTVKRKKFEWTVQLLNGIIQVDNKVFMFKSAAGTMKW